MLDSLLGRFRWWRRLIGGHWELWLTEPGIAAVWSHMPHGCTRVGNPLARRPPYAYGTPACEDWA